VISPGELTQNGYPAYGQNSMVNSFEVLFASAGNQDNDFHLNQQVGAKKLVKLSYR
jgi:hypothetical protein